MHVKDEELLTALSGRDGVPALEAAAYARVDTAAGAARYLGPLGNYLVARPAARAEARAITERTDLPLDAAVVLAVGDGQVHVWSADPMLSQVHEHLGSVPAADIAGADSVPGRGWSTLTLRFADGDVVELQARGDVSSLARTLSGEG